jgi:hypothetical protein
MKDSWNDLLALWVRLEEVLGIKPAENLMTLLIGEGRFGALARSRASRLEQASAAE